MTIINFPTDHLIVSPAEQLARARARRQALFPQGPGWLMRPKKLEPEPEPILEALPEPAKPLPEIPTDIERLRLAFSQYKHLIAGNPANRVQTAMVIAASAFEVSIRDLQSPDKRRPLCYVRQKIMTFVHECALDFYGKRPSMPAVGKAFNRDHTTVLHARKKYEGLIEEARAVV
jgi:hypothetical protein